MFFYVIFTYYSNIFIIHLEAADKVLELCRKKTFSAVGLGQERMPFLSTQHNA